jgi:hypothetical protein
MISASGTPSSRATLSAIAPSVDAAPVDELAIARSIAELAICCSSASSRSPVSRASFWFKAAAEKRDEARAAFGALRCLSVAALWRRALAGSPPALERRLIAST